MTTNACWTRGFFIIGRMSARHYQLLGEVGFLYLIPNFLRMKEAHRSAAIVPQRFDHPHHGLERTHSLMVIGASGQNQISMLFNPGGEAQSTIDRGSVTS